MKTLKSGLGLLLLMIIMLAGNTLLAQPCKTDNITINTGYDPVMQTPIAIGAADPEWYITSYSPDLLNPAKTTLTSVPTPGSARAADGVGGITDPNSRWISFYDPPGSTWSNWYQTLTAGDYHFVMKRNFTIVCGATDLDVNIKISRDNYVHNVIIRDATNTVISNSVIDPAITVNVPSYYNSFYQIPVFTLPNLAPGTYSIEVDVHNLHIAGSANPHGVNIVGSLTSPSGNLLAPGQTECECECEDKCYWKVQGNNILNGNNIFGTLTNHDIRIKTTNNDRGIIMGGNATLGGFMGWNTVVPTARFHVNCIDGNDEASGLSDIRFENLEHSYGSILVIDDRGYVYNSRVRLTPDGGIGKAEGEMYEEQQSKIIQLEQEVNLLKEQLTLLVGEQMPKAATVKPESQTSALYQNIPNPFGAETVIPYYIKSLRQSVFLLIHDMNGREIARHLITEKGKGQVTVNSEKIVPGQYTYSLIIDGEIIDTRSMTLSK